MSIGGSIERSNKKELGQIVPPFPGNSANNGLSVDSVSSLIVLGQSVGAVGNPAILLSNREIPAANFILSFNADAAQTNNIVQFKNTAAAVRARITNNAEFSNTGGQTNCELFGEGVSVGTGSGSSVFGKSAASVGNANVVMGRGAVANGSNSVVIGEASLDSTVGSNVIIGHSARQENAFTGIVLIGDSSNSANSNNVTCIGSGSFARARTTIIGYLASSSGVNSTGIGDSVTIGATHEYSIAIGFGTQTTAANQLVVGCLTAATGGVNDVYIGRGVVCAEANNLKFQVTGSSGNNMAGNTLTIAGGRATGNATPGAVLIQVSQVGASGTTLQTLRTYGKFESRTVTFGDIDAIGNSVRIVIDDANTRIRTNGISQMIGTTTAFTNGAGAAAGTLLNAPAAGDPTKWIPIDDNGTTRYIPAW